MGINTKVYPAIEGEGWTDPFSGTFYPKRDYTATPTIVTTYEGAVLCDREQNYYDDSDGYSHVWDTESRSIKHIGTWTTRAGHDHAGTRVDAYDGPYADDILEYLRGWYLRVSQEIRSRQYDQDKADALDPAIKGKRVRVIKGRKVPIGTEGIVIWAGEQSYSYHNTTWRIGIKDDAGTVHWTAASNAEVLDPEIPHPDDYETDAEIIERASKFDLRTLANMHCGYGAAVAGLVRL